MRTARQEAGHEARRATPALIKALAVLFNKRKDFDKRMGYVHDYHKTPWAPGTMPAKRVIPNAFQWNEAVLEPGDPLNNGLLSLLVIKDDLSPKLIGTAFLVAAEGDSATAISAAHCFEEIRRHVDPDNQRHHPSTHFEFVPLPNEVELDRVKAWRLLRAGAERQRRRSTKQSNKLALAELPSDEAPQSSTSLDDQGAVHRSDIFLLMLV